MNVYIIEGNIQYRDMFTNRGWNLVDSIAEADLIQFTGGADVTPSLYGAERLPGTMDDPIRDRKEAEMYDAVKGKTPCAGICRGGQMLWCLNGGEMWQDVPHHAIYGEHELYSAVDSTYICDVSSTHHQMMRVPDDNLFMHKNILAIGNVYQEHEGVIGLYYDTQHGKGLAREHQDLEIEVALFKDTKTLCFQPHPEFKDGDMQDYYFKLINEAVSL